MNGAIVKRESVDGDDTCCVAEDVTWRIEENKYSNETIHTPGWCLACETDHTLIVKEQDPIDPQIIESNAVRLRNQYPDSGRNNFFDVAEELKNWCHVRGIPADVRRVLVGANQTPHWAVFVSGRVVEEFENDEMVVIDPTISRFATQFATGNNSVLANNSDLPTVLIASMDSSPFVEWYDSVPPTAW